MQIFTHFLGSQLHFNVVFLYTAANNNPEFLGYKRVSFPGQLPPRPQEILPRRAKYPKDFKNDWKKIGSKKTKKYQNTLTLSGIRRKMLF